jgi:hypothetical protein
MSLVVFVSIKDVFKLLFWGLKWNIMKLEERQRA